MRNKIFLVMCALALPASAEEAAKPVTVNKAGVVDCAKTPNVHIANGKLKLEFKGACAHVSIGGGKNEITAESIASLDVAGAENKITVTKLDALSIAGAKNQITYTGPVDEKKLDATIAIAG